ncbi:major facilitator superfamily domain-containing protein [Mycena alexandri]|uniref:Major facilitator superfamily domain-containing protein n=1 Tax=Mycena alexandri TaxID=1745969 RepID=A0AAD6XH28_9AGAR|nr:major facilitator superfamily domain-containing protein [Mycena alexandri]
MSSRESWSPGAEETFETDPLVTIFPSRSRSAVHPSRERASAHEREPLLGPHIPRKKPFYRARPLWLVPFAVLAALIRGSTLAPRVEIYTQLSCSRLHHSYNHTTNTLLDAPFYYDRAPSSSITFIDPSSPPTDDSDESRQLPQSRCSSDPAVQAGAARIQTTFTITMGLLSALTAGWWGHLGERRGRTKVLAIATFGWFLTDLTFILASTPSSPLFAHGRTLLFIAPIFEGLLGGWSSLQAGTSAYISDCTSSGSRASVFSRFTGVSFVGFSLGPIIGGWIIRHPIPFLSGAPLPGQGPGQGQSVTAVFCIAAIGSFINFCLMLFVIPESVTKEQRDRATRTLPDIAVVSLVGEAEPPKTAIAFVPRIIKEFFSPLAIFLPVPIFIDGTTRKRKDWSLTLLACALFGYLLSAGLYQIKYLYGSLVYSWGPEQLGYYVSFMGGGRALFLLFVFPLVISKFKPKPDVPPTQSLPVPGIKPGKPKPTKAHLAREIKFDLRLTRISLCIDILANASIILAPAPAYKMHHLAMAATAGSKTDSQFRSSQALFVVASWIASWGAGLIPAIHSLALCIVQARAMLEASATSQGDGAAAPVIVDAGTGKLFGALAVLQATGQMILGPLLFGLVYSGTVATFPKAVFCTALGMLVLALTATLLVRSPLPLTHNKGKAPAVRRQRRIGHGDEEAEARGRSRRSKDLGYGSTSEAESPPEQGPSASGSN